MDEILATKLQAQDISMPGIGKKPTGGEFSKYRVRYMRVDMSDPASIGDMENIATRSIHGDGVIITNKISYTCMQDFFWIVEYFELAE